MALYLKYRPQKIQELDLTKVREGLKEILSGKETPHAFLFVGPKGTGKTSSARILAKSVNCSNPPASGGEPCNKCDSCKQISDGRLMDLIEIDAASNRGIDDIRDLKSKIKLAPSSSKFKVYIIDEVHMLTNEAFNALLKTLEEPPKHAKFVLCTTEPHKLPGTIVSRCTKIEFHKATTDEVIRSLKRVTQGEKIKIADKDLKLIAGKSGGSFRDAVKVLEQLVVTGKKVSSKRVAELVSRGIGEKNLDEWLLLIYQRKTKEALDWLLKAVDQGVNVQQLAVDLVERFRQLLMIKLKVDKGEDIKEIEEIESLKVLTFRAHQAAIETKRAVVDSLPLELMIVEWGEDKQPKTKVTKEEVKVETVAKKVEISTEKLKKTAGKLSLKSVLDKWGKVLEAMRPKNHSLEALLRATKPTGFEGDHLVLEVFYKFHKERLEAERYRQMVEQVASQVLESPVRIRYYLGERVKKTTMDNPDDNITAEVKDDIIKSAEEIFGVEVN